MIKMVFCHTYNRQDAYELKQELLFHEDVPGFNFILILEMLIPKGLVFSPLGCKPMVTQVLWTVSASGYSLLQSHLPKQLCCSLSYLCSSVARHLVTFFMS